MTEQRTKKMAFADAVGTLMTPGGPRLSESEQAQIEREAEEAEHGIDDTPLRRAADANASIEDEAALPPWAAGILPAGLTPPPYAQVGYIRFLPELTGRPDLGQRTCCTWGLSVADERLAKQMSRGDSTRLYEELAKQTIRAVDGRLVDRTGRAGHAGGGVDVRKFWEQIGSKGRMLLINQYLQSHTPTASEMADFFLSCCTYRTAAAG